MGVNLVERPHQFCFSKNQIRYRFDVPLPARLGLKIEVKLFYRTVTGIAGTELDTFSLKPFIDSKCYFDIQDYIDSLLNYVHPSMTDAFTNANEQAIFFYIHYRDVDNDTPDPAWITTEEAHQRLALKGGIERHRFSRNNYFLNYFDVEKPFLTWQPANRFVFDDQENFLTFFNAAIDAANLKAIITVTSVTGDIGIKEVEFVGTCALFHINVGINFHDLKTTVSDDIHYYDVCVKHTDGTVITNNHRFYVEYRPAYTVYDIIFHNSLGGIDPVRIKSDSTRTFDRKTEEAGKGADVNDWSALVKAGTFRFADITRRDKFKGDMGWFSTRKELEAALDIFMSKNVFTKIDGRWVPVVITTNSADINTADKKFSLPVEWSIAYDNEVFTPSFIALGTGEDNEDY